MSTADLLTFDGRCVGVTHSMYLWPGDPPLLGALEIAWDDGSFMTFDIDPDWTLHVSREQWRDPFHGVDVTDPAWDMGSWTQVPVEEADPVSDCIGLAVSAWTPRFNEVDELVGLDLCFGEVTLLVGSWAGDLTVRVRRA